MNAIVTITSGDFYNEMSKITHPLMRNYASKVNADFIVLEGLGDHKIPHYRKLDIKNLLDKYSRIIYVDTDILIRPDAPDLFEMVSKEELGIFEEGRFVERAANFLNFMDQVGFRKELWDGKYYNTGVMVLSQIHQNLFDLPPEEVDNFKEQSYLNVMICHTQTKIKSLSYKFNRMHCMDAITGEERFDSYFMHYAGINVLMSEEAQLELMKKDIKIWEENAPNYYFKKHIAVMVGGGMGDQICAEPVIRFMKEKVYKGDDIIIFSDWPELFSHLELPSYKHKATIKAPNMYRVLHTLRSPEHESWQYMTHPLVHNTDFSSLQALCMTLPIANKSIKLPCNLPSLLSVHNKAGKLDVLIHPGRGWESKTFPVDVWQSYIDILNENGFKIGIIGKRISKEQGIVEVNTSKCVDLVDKLTVEELIALISITPILISNDSAPIHIAGAFDNWIGLIATCKHPDRVLPFRKGLQDYKTAKLERWPLYDFYNQQPTQVDGATIDKCTEEQIRRACPSAEKVFEFVRNARIEKLNV